MRILGMDYYRALEAEYESLKEQIILLAEQVENGTQKKVTKEAALLALKQKEKALNQKLINIGAYEVIHQVLVKEGDKVEKLRLVNITAELAKFIITRQGKTILYFQSTEPTDKY